MFRHAAKFLVLAGPVTLSLGALGCGGNGSSEPRPEVASMSITPESLSVVMSARVYLLGTVWDTDGNRVHERVPEWESADQSVFLVPSGADAEILGIAVSPGVTAVTASWQGFSTTIPVRVSSVAYSSIVPGGCGLALDATVWCWAHSAASTHCPELHGSRISWNCNVPSPLMHGLRFASLSVRGFYDTGLGSTLMCGLTSAGAAYCWGRGSANPDIAGPQRVSGQLVLKSVESGALVCGLTVDGSAYCLKGSPLEMSAVPGGLTFASISPGGNHTCGVDAGGLAYCWGTNRLGELGTQETLPWCQIGGPYNSPDSVPCTSVPALVAGTAPFRSLAAGGRHTCGISREDTAYCWGANAFGQLGDGSTTDRALPVAVAGGLTFMSLSASRDYTCGIATSGAAYCWGANGFGQLGTGVLESSFVPAPVTGGLRFSQIATGHRATCALTTAGVAWCWGQDPPDGTGILTASPVRVLGQP